jgi:hypothetical protein
MLSCTAREGRVIYGATICRKELLVEPPSGYIIRWERHADNRYSRCHLDHVGLC